MNIWNFMRWLQGKTLHTLARQAPFTVRSIGEDRLTLVIHSSKMERVITRSEVESAFNELWVSREVTLKEITEHHSEASASYIVTLLAQFPDVDFLQKPVRLYWKA
jgi:hypothetical protein